MERRNFIKYSSLATLGFAAGCSSEDQYQFPEQRMNKFDLDTTSIEIIVDTSPSMDEKLNGEAKIVSAQKAIASALDVFNNYYKQKKSIEAGMVCLTGFGSARVVVPLSPFNYELLKTATKSLRTESSGTALGKSLALAERELRTRARGRENIIMLTDGESNAGRNPEVVWKSILGSNELHGNSTSLYVVAFNTREKYFTKLKDLGAVLMSAQDGYKLQQLFKDTSEMILEAPLPDGVVPKLQ